MSDADGTKSCYEEICRQANKIKRLRKIVRKAASCWGFMSNDLSLPEDERRAAKLAHDKACKEVE